METTAPVLVFCSLAAEGQISLWHDALGRPGREHAQERARAFVLYSDNRTAFTIGGLHTLFEQTLYEHLCEVINAGEAYLSNPVCMEETGACHACLHISEMSCEHFNRNLHRKSLFGRLEADGSEYIGYWDQRCTVEA